MSLPGDDWATGAAELGRRRGEREREGEKHWEGCEAGFRGRGWGSGAERLGLGIPEIWMLESEGVWRPASGAKKIRIWESWSQGLHAVGVL